MPGSTDMGEREQFLKEYQEQVLDTLTLPPEWSVRYTVQSCLKDGELQGGRKFYFRPPSCFKFVLFDRMDRNRISCCGSSITARFLAHWTIWSGRGGSTWSGNM